MVFVATLFTRSLSDVPPLPLGVLLAPLALVLAAVGLVVVIFLVLLQAINAPPANTS